MNATAWVMAVCCCVNVGAIVHAPGSPAVGLQAGLAMFCAVCFLAHYRGGAS